MRSFLFFACLALAACGGGVSPGGGSGSGSNDKTSAPSPPSGSTSSGGAGSGAQTPATSGSGSGANCNYPPVSNPDGCPASYSYMYSGKDCPQAGLECWYPGQGDGAGDGCFASALLACRANDGGTPTWTAAQ